MPETFFQLEDELENCAGCGKECLLNLMHPINDGYWVCQSCYRDLLEQIE
jgi:hypothetical protein